MRILGTLLLFWLLPPCAVAKTGQQSWLSRDPAKWTWSDSNCSIHDRGNLVRVLEKHKGWLQKYQPYLGNEEALASHGACKDPLRANFSGAALVKADITGAIFLTQIFKCDSMVHKSRGPTNLKHADFAKATVKNGKFDSAQMGYANLKKKAEIQHPNFSRGYLSHGYLTMARLQDVDFPWRTSKMLTFPRFRERVRGFSLVQT
jgi:hypothetical protein